VYKREGKRERERKGEKEREEGAAIIPRGHPLDSP
jgi:hypothetical protein